MLEVIGVAQASDLYDGIPSGLKLNRPLNLPAALPSERDLRRHVQGILNKNTPCSNVISFLGGGCWQHDIPAVCDEINSRAEFLTAYGGDTYADLGKYQAIFEFQSMIGELVGFDMVSAPVYDWAGATTSALMMAARITGRRKVLIPRIISPEKTSHIHNVASDQVDAVIDRHSTRRQDSSISPISAANLMTPSPLSIWRFHHFSASSMIRRRKLPISPTPTARSSSSASTAFHWGCSRLPPTTAQISSSARRNRSASICNTAADFAASSPRVMSRAFLRNIPT